MNVTHVSTYDIQGGAARATYRLHKGLQGLGVDSRILVQQKSGLDPAVFGPEGLKGVVANKLSTFLDLLPLRILNREKKDAWGLSWRPTGIGGRIAATSPDIVHLHWVGCGFLPLPALKAVRSPLVWTIHDSWPFTGGCILPGDCLRYRQRCGACPQLGSTRQYDLSRWEHDRKERIWRDVPLTVVAPSRWIADCAGASSLFRITRIETIPHGLELDRFRPVEKSAARQLLGLPLDRKLILFGATILDDSNKGFHLLREALQRLDPGLREQAELVVFGASSVPDPVSLGLPLHTLGRLHDDVSLALAYSAADVMCVPSLQESFGQAASEAMACGTPVVAFAATGLLDIVDSQVNGYLAGPYDPAELAKGIEWVISDNARHRGLCLAAREKAEREFDLQKTAARYHGLYKELLTSARR